MRTLALAAASLTLSCGKSPLETAIASSQKQWWRDGVCYEIFVRSFVDSDGDGVGDLRGLTSRLDYVNDGNPNSVADLGANCIWLMPISKSVSYHGYDVTDYYHVDPRYGTDEDFRQLMREAHRRAIHIIVDFVPNHSSDENPWFQSALQGLNSPYRNWYRWSAAKPDQLGPWGQVAWHKSPLHEEYYYGVFWHGMPDLNYETPALLAEMKNVLRHWVTNMGADGFRFDAVPYLVEEGSELKHTRGTHEVLRQLGAAVRSVNPSSFTVGEMADGNAQILASYYPDQLDAYFAFDVASGTLESARTGAAAPFLSAVREANSLFPAGRWSPFLTNHDQPRVMTAMAGDRARARVAASAMLMLPGLPFVYYGEEIGMMGSKPDEQIRTPMQWSNAPGAGFTAGTPWESPQSDWAATNVQAQDADAASLLNHYQRLIHLRNAHSALGTGELVVGTANDPALAAFVRRSPTETILVIANFGARAVPKPSVTMDSGSGTPLTGRLELIHEDPSNGCAPDAVVAAGGSATLGQIAPYGLCVFRLAGS
ncbi:MAG TPA: alpha-amylase family glycosyl hydrolase [Gemmatimonadaceae bacterium]|nr:alpha-amylase family glycosyl hydrolase [Gemmatimonadaceae bacterium]